MSVVNQIGAVVQAAAKIAERFPDAIPSLLGLLEAIFVSEDPRAAIQRAATAASTRRWWHRSRSVKQ